MDRFLTGHTGPLIKHISTKINGAILGRGFLGEKLTVLCTPCYLLPLEVVFPVRMVTAGMDAGHLGVWGPKRGCLKDAKPILRPALPLS